MVRGPIHQPPIAARWACFAGILGVLAIGTAPGQPNNPKPGKPRNEVRAGEARGSPVKAALLAEITTLDDELAGLIQFRGEMPPEGAARLELLIDLRITARWLLLRSAEAPPESDLQTTSFLRAKELSACAKTAAEVFRNSPKPTPPQIAAMGKIHALTFSLKELKQIKPADELCGQIGSLLAVAAGPLPPEVRQIPLMRPVAVTGSSGPSVPATRPAQIDPASRANLLTVSAPLKKQVLALLSTAAATEAEAKTDPKKQEEATEVAGVLLRVLELAEGLSHNAAIDPQSRPRIEQQLAEALALYTDPRLRGPGLQRISAMDAYAQTLTRLRKFSLRPELQQRLAPAFAWAGEHPDQGPRLLTVVEDYLAVCGRVDAHAATTLPALPPREARLAADAVKSATLHREAFLADAANLGRGTLGADVNSFTQHVDAIRLAIDLAEMYEHVPQALQTLLAFKPKPGGGLERRVAGALAAQADLKSSPAKDEAGKALSELVKLADLAAELDWPSTISPEVARIYTHDKLVAFEAKRKDWVAELAGQLASGKEMDSAKLKRLEQMRMVRASLAEAAVLENAIRRAEPLSRWVDWAVDPADLKSVFTPYREALASAFDVYSTDAQPAVSWPSTHARYRPLIRVLLRALPYADQCNTMPTALAGDIGRLMTPMDVPRFAGERFTSFNVTLWARFEQAGDSGAAAFMAESLTKRGGN